MGAPHDHAHGPAPHHPHAHGPASGHGPHGHGHAQGPQADFGPHGGPHGGAQGPMPHHGSHGGAPGPKPDGGPDGDMGGPHDGPDGGHNGGQLTATNTVLHGLHCCCWCFIAIGHSHSRRCCLLGVPSIADVATLHGIAAADLPQVQSCSSTTSPCELCYEGHSSHVQVFVGLQSPLLRLTTGHVSTWASCLSHCPIFLYGC